ncbi:n-acetylglutamate synthase [Sphingobacterium thalpophilum]|uniref:n-acetylglutamate synthase n=1 Tax=Sphingobacterium thalpophilum TaxID=259 RepID=UPI003DA2DEB7
MIDYNNRFFRAVKNSDNGETSSETIFHYKQKDSILTADYQGGKIISGHLIGIIKEDGVIDMRYHQINIEGKIMTGECVSRPEILPNGNVRLHEEWRWTSGDLSSGKSIIEEFKP